VLITIRDCSKICQWELILLCRLFLYLKLCFVSTGEIGTVISKNSNELKKPDALPSTNEGKIEEEFTVARLYVSKMKSEVKNLVNKSALLEQSQNDAQSKIENMEKELSDSRLLVGKDRRHIKLGQYSQLFIFFVT
jgi:hypothetical protein